MKGCLALKPLTEFHARKRSRDGLRFSCKACDAQDSARWKVENKERLDAVQRQWYEANAERLRAGQKAYKAANPHKHCAVQGNRRAALMNRTPKWADRAAIATVYAKAQALKEQGQSVHVDHIYPLQGKTVSGLHVHENLPILSAMENLSKGCRVMEQEA